MGRRHLPAGLGGRVEALLRRVDGDPFLAFSSFETSGSTRRARKPFGPSHSCARTSDGRPTAPCTSRARKSRASTGWRSRAAPTSARASSRSCRDCSPTSSTTEAGTAGRRMEHGVVVPFDALRSRGPPRMGARRRNLDRSDDGASARRGVPARTRTVPPRCRRVGPADPQVHHVLVPATVVLRRAACARLLPDDGREAGRSDRRCGRPRGRQARGGRPLAAREHAPGTDAFRDGGRGFPSRWNTLRALRVLRWADFDTGSETPAVSI